MDLYSFVFAIGAAAIFGAIGWLSGSDFNKAKAYNIFIKPITKKEKMVTMVSGEEADLRTTLANRVSGSEALWFDLAGKKIMRFPISVRNKTHKGVITGLFDARYGHQLPFETDYLQYYSVYNDKGELLGTQAVENKKNMDYKVDSTISQNLQIGAIEAGKIQARASQSDDLKKQKRLLYLLGFIGVVALLIGILNAKFASDALNLIAQIHAPANQTAILYPST